MVQEIGSVTQQVSSYVLMSYPNKCFTGISAKNNDKIIFRGNIFLRKLFESLTKPNHGVFFRN